MEGNWAHDLPVRNYNSHRIDSLREPRDGQRHHQQRPGGHEARSPRNHENQHGQPSRKPIKCVSLEDGIADLFDCVDETIHYISHFEQDYQQDIHRIRDYCDEGLLDAVWMEKILPTAKPSRDRQRNIRSDSFDHQDRQKPGPMTFRNATRQLLEALGAVLAAAESRPSQRRPSRYKNEDVSRIRQQLHRSHQNLRKSFFVVAERPSEMESVKTELEMLSVFLSRNGARGGGNRYDTGHTDVPSRRQPEGTSEVKVVGQWGEPGEQRETWDGAPEGGEGRLVNLAPFR